MLDIIIVMEIYWLYLMEMEFKHIMHIVVGYMLELDNQFHKGKL